MDSLISMHSDILMNNFFADRHTNIIYDLDNIWKRLMPPYI